MNNLLLTREQAATFLGIDPKSFDKYIRSNPDFKSFMLGKQERFVKTQLIKFIEAHCF
ncbi:helix-turn-helix domain-containing protein [Lapidilactobacillus dextrinicus]|uniref:helix-turn-helix domain-containing protein n=1 Tax=Lapidilactobacillus dextrinicus TaxID=51664 RepID=UPI0022E7A3C7|nr:helix-turn-helix domain-containing protein [Lapidilactobacillus dextrinicus]